MAVRRGQIEAVDALQVCDLLQRRGLERRLVLQRVQRDAFQQVAERQVQVLRQALQHLEQPFLQAHAGLDALDFASLLYGFGGHAATWRAGTGGEASHGLRPLWCPVMMVHMYQITKPLIPAIALLSLWSTAMP